MLSPLSHTTNRCPDVFSNPNKKFEISTPYDPVHLTHVGFNSDTGEFTVRLYQPRRRADDSIKGLPKEWQQLLSDSGISQQEQAANPQAVVDIVAFYQDATKGLGEPSGTEGDEVWKKFGKSNNANGAPVQFEQPVRLCRVLLPC